MKRTTKRIISLFILTLVVFSFNTVANAAVINEVMEERELIKGVTYKRLRRLENYGFVDAYVVQADIKEPHVKMEVLKSDKGESFLENTYQMAKDSDALAAVNADFFATKRGQSGRGSAVGVEVRDGELKSSASVAEKMNTLYKVFDEDKFYINSFAFDITLTAANGRTDKIKLVNKYDDLTGIVMYTDDWAETSVGSVGGIIEVAVDKNGIVTNKVTEADPIAIPEDGYVLSAHMSYNTFLLDYVNVGDKISVDVKSTPNIDYIETAVGGGGIILNNGTVPSSFSHNISGRNPRSAVGIDETGTIITLVAVDGRNSYSKGMTQTELGYLMKDLGCFTALNFDGGGSTLMAVDNNGEKEVVNTPSDNNYRNVTNSLGVVTTAEDNMPAADIKLKLQDNMFLNSSVALNIVGIDKYNRETEIDTSNVTYTADSGNITENIFSPAHTGSVRITASCGGFTTEKTINVLSYPREISFTETTITLNSGESYIPVIVGKDQSGKSANIRFADMNVSMSNNSVAALGNYIIAENKGATVITARFGEVTANMAVLVDGAEKIDVPDNITIPDEKNTHKELSGDGAFRFSVFGNTRKITTLFDKFLMNTALYKIKQSGDFGVFLGTDVSSEDIGTVLNDYVMAKKYNCFGSGVNSFITLPNVSGMIYTNDVSVWTKFQEDAKKSEKNLFIFLDGNFISYDEAERQVFYKTVNQAADDGKNVYVFGGGLVNKSTVSDGVHYVNTAGVFSNVAIDGVSPSYVQYVLVTVNGNEVTYEYKFVLGE